MMKQKRKRLWALLLSAALIVTQLPAVAMAENAAPEDGSIASFEPLDNGVAKQTVDVGTELSELTLPDTVTATIYHVTEDMVIPDEDNMEDDSGDTSTATPSDAEGSVSDNSSGDSSDKDSGTTVTTVTTSTEKIPVTWDSEPAYDGDRPDTYVFKPDVGDYALSNGVKLPRITVTVAADGTGNPPAEPLPCTLTEGCTLTDGHESGCVPVAVDAPKKPCVCQVPCTEDLTDPDCPVCKAADAVPEDCAALTAAPAVLREGDEWVCTTEDELNYAMNNIQPGDTVILRLDMNTHDIEDRYTYTQVLLIVENYGMTSLFFKGDVGTCTIKSGNVRFNASVDSLTIEGGDVTLERNATVNDITMTGGAFVSRSGAQITGRFAYQGGTLDNGSVPLSGTGVFVNESGQSVTIQNPANPGEDVVISPGGEVDANGMVTDQTLTFSITPISGDGYEIIPLEGYSTSGIAAGGVCKFRIEIKEGYRAGEVAVKIGSVLLTPDSNGIYTIINIQKDIVLSVTGIKKLYSITVGVSGGGTAVASVQEATQGENVTLTATPDQNSVFAGWTIEEGAAPLADESAENTSFTMPAGNVTVKATFDTVTNNTITTSPATLDFGSKTVNYAAPDAQTVTITNTCNSPITGYAVSGSTNFDVTYASSAIPVGGNATFTVQPQIGLAVNTYEETLTITTTESSTATVIVKFSVVDKTIPVTGVMLNKSIHSLYKNEIVILTATVQPDNATNKSVSWTSSNINVATVDASGKVTAHAVGTAAITATTNDGGKRAVCDITVKPDPPSGGSSSSGSGKSSYTNPDILYGTWVQADTGIWMFRQTGGSYVRNRWGKADGLWYYFDSDGKMLTGWQWLGNQWYYLHTEETARTKAGMKEGAMASGWHFDPGHQKWFYLDAGGAMVAGWREIDGKWYYFNPVPDGQRGIMLTDAWIDGWYVDKNGVWDREAKKEK